MPSNEHRNSCRAAARRSPAARSGRLAGATAGVLAVLSGAAAIAGEPPHGELIVKATGFKTAEGQAVAKLFLPGENVRGKGHWQATGQIHDGRAEFHFGGLAAGSYAVVVFHDLNSNDTIDHGALGPAEPLGFSGAYTLSLLNGLPTFEKLQFAFQGPTQTLPVAVR